MRRRSPPSKSRSSTCRASSAGRPLYEILGGAVRDRVPYSAYLFYKFERHRDDPGYPADDWGEVSRTTRWSAKRAEWWTSSASVRSSSRPASSSRISRSRSLRKLRQTFPDHPLRIDPNGGWSVETTRRIMPRLEGLLEYLEDPTNSLGEMAEVATFAPMPLATNMVTIAFGHIPETVRLNAVQVVLSDHHYWGGLRATQQLAHIGRVFGLGISMHSNSHLGISLAAMTHVAATIPNLAYACDTHYPWQVEEVIEGGKLALRERRACPPEGPGPRRPTRPQRRSRRLHQQYLDCGIRKRDDANEMRKYVPDFNPARPRF